MLSTVASFDRQTGGAAQPAFVGPADDEEGPAAAIAHATRRLLERHYTERITLEVIGDALGLSPFKILRSFQRCYGISPHKYLIERRVSKASELLVDGVRPAEVAVLVGFVDQSHMTKHFKRIRGTTPGRFCTRSRSAVPGAESAGMRAAPGLDAFDPVWRPRAWPGQEPGKRTSALPRVETSPS